MGCLGSKEAKIAASDPKNKYNEDHISSAHLLQNVVTSNKNKRFEDIYDTDSNIILGKGMSGSVYLCTHKITGVPYAVKILDSSMFSMQQLESMKQEIKIMQELDHPNILRLHEYFEGESKVYLVSEYCSGGELLDRLMKEYNQQYSEGTAAAYVRTILAAVAFCHAHNIVHRDLKLENFVFVNNSPDSQLKIIDFGLSKRFVPKEKIRGAVGTPQYVAPEVLSGEYDAKCDVWSIGIITYVLLSGRFPFDGITPKDVFREILHKSLVFDEEAFFGVSESAKDFICQCLNKDVKGRPTAEEALKHPWFKSPSLSRKGNVSGAVLEKLRGFGAKSGLAKLFLEVAAYSLQPAQVDELRHQFQALDADDNGDISINDMKALLRDHLSLSDMKKVLMAVDHDRSGTISFHEFLAATLNDSMLTEANIRLAFESLSEHKEYFTRADLERILGKDLTFYPIDQMLLESQLSSESQIKYPQFRAILVEACHAGLEPKRSMSSPIVSGVTRLLSLGAQ